MADRKASVHVDAKTSGFKRGMDDAAKDAERAGRKAGDSLKSSLSAAAKGGIGALRNMFSVAKSAIAGIGGLVGGIGFGAMVKGAIDAEAQFRKIAFTVEGAGDQVVSWQALMGQAQQAAQRFGQDVDQLGAAFTAVFETTGNLKFARATLDNIAEAATASGQSVDTIAGIVANLNRQFGITAEEIPDALAAVLDLGRKGGASIEELGAQLGKIGRLAGVAGLEGQAGMARLVGVLNTLTAAGAETGPTVERLNMIFVKLRGSVEQIKKQFKIDVSGMDALKGLGEVLKATRGRAAALTKVFGDQGTFIAQAFGKRFESVIEQTKGAPEVKLAAAVADFEKQIASAAKTTSTGASITARAERERQATNRQIKSGMVEIQKAFTQPEMIAAIQTLAKVFPDIAKAIAGFVGFAAERPGTTAALVGAGVFAKGAAGAALTPIIQGAFQAGGTAASGLLMAGISKGGTAAGAAMTSAINMGGKTAAGLMGASLAVLATQIEGLVRDLKTHDKDVSDERENLLQAAEKQGRKFAVRDVPLAERLRRGSFREVMEGGQEELSRDPRTGKVRSRIVTKAEQRDKAAGPITVSATPRDVGPIAPFVAPPAAQAAQERAAAATRDAATGANQQALVTALRGTLNVKITNPEAIGRGGLTPGKPKTGPNAGTP